MTEAISTALGRSDQSNHVKCDILVIDVNTESMAVLKKQYECPYFRILVIGRANAGKTTILEKVCGVAQGTKPIIYDKHGIELKANMGPKHGSEPEPEPLPSPAASVTHLTPSIEVSKLCNERYV